MSYNISFKAINDLKTLNSDKFQGLEYGANIKDITSKLVSEISNDISSVFGYNKITVQKKWLQIQWDPDLKLSLYYNAGMYGQEGLLFFNPLMLADLVNQFGKDVLVGILAHEVGHHLSYLLFISKGIILNDWEDEFCADYIAGLIMRLGQRDPKIMIKLYLTYLAEGGKSHPDGKSRAIAFQKGFKLIDQDSSTVFYQTPSFAKNLNPRLTFTPDFIQRKLTEDILLPLRKRG